MEGLRGRVKAYDVSFWGNENILKLFCADACTTVRI